MLLASQIEVRHSSQTPLLQYAAHEAENSKRKGQRYETDQHNGVAHTHHIDIEAVDKGFILAAGYIQHLCKTRVQDRGQAGTKSC